MPKQSNDTWYYGSGKYRVLCDICKAPVSDRLTDMREHLVDKHFLSVDDMDDKDIIDSFSDNKKGE